MTVYNCIYAAKQQNKININLTPIKIRNHQILAAYIPAVYFESQSQSIHIDKSNSDGSWTYCDFSSISLQVAGTVQVSSQTAK